MQKANDILISIIIPVYNVELYLRDCLDSILMQDLSACEIICVNDGSTDGCGDILCDYASKYGHVLRVITKENGGLSDARNRGVQEAQGKYLYFVDSDDYLQPHAIKTIKDAILSNPDADVLQYDNIITNHGKRLMLFPPESSETMSIREYFKRFHTRRCVGDVSVCVVSYSYSYSYSYWKANNLQFDKGLRYEDKLFLYRLCVKPGTIRMIHVDEPFYVFRESREGSISTNVSLQHYKDRQFSWREADRLFRKNGMNDAAYYANLFDYASWVLYEAKLKGFVSIYDEIITKHDVEIFKKGILNHKMRKEWLLLWLSPSFMLRYNDNECSTFVRKLINRTFSVLDKYLPQWLIRKDM